MKVTFCISTRTADGQSHGWEWVVDMPVAPVVGDKVGVALDGCNCEYRHRFVVDERAFEVDDDGGLELIWVGLVSEPGQMDVSLEDCMMARTPLAVR